jgi:hypothetical protein
MGDTIDFSLLTGKLAELEREARLLRLQVAQLVNQGATHDQRLATLEQGFHDLVREVSAGFGQQQQQITRIEHRLEGLGTALDGLRGGSRQTIDMLSHLLAEVRRGGSG